MSRKKKIEEKVVFVFTDGSSCSEEDMWARVAKRLEEEKKKEEKK